MAENTMRLTLKAHEKMFLNGAVIRFDRKTKVEILNNANFLLEAHVLQADETNTPLKQLYYAAQIILMDPAGSEAAVILFQQMLTRLIKTTTNKVIVNGLRDCSELMEHNRIFDILKILRSLFPLEAEILEQCPKSVKRLRIKNCGEKQTVEKQISDSIESHSALKKTIKLPDIKKPSPSFPVQEIYA